MPEPAPSARSSCLALTSRNDANIWKITVLLGVIEAVADNELVRNLEPDVIALQGELAPRWRVEQRSGFQAPRLARQKHLFQIRHGQPGVVNVFHEDDVLVLHSLIDVFQQAHFTGGVPPA